MPFGSVRLVPGVNVERTATLLEAGYSASQFIRFKDGLAQKLGGWQKFYPFGVSGIPRDLHAWQDLNQANHLGYGTTAQLGVITSGTLQVITPQTLISDFTPNFSTVINTPTVTIVDSNISNVTTFDAILFNTPVSVGGIILSGLYPIVTVTGTHSYTITAATNATSTVNNTGAVPVFTTTAGSQIVSVLLTAHGLSVGSTVVFPIPTTGDLVTISGLYTVQTVPDANHFTINANTQGGVGSTFSMNSGNAELVYYINLGPAAAGSGYGLGGYGSGGFGTGVVPASQTGNPITPTDWTLDNWGQLLVGCPKNGGLYTFDPTGGFANAGLINSGPAFNTGAFVSVTQQILVAFGSTVPQTIGIQQDPMLVRWSDVGNFNQWSATSATQAGSYRIPLGSMIVGGMATPQQNLIWTDLDLWAMNYLGFPLVFGFNKIGSGCGLASLHAAGQLRGSVYWMGRSNFYVLSGNGVTVLPCPVWDQVFQNLDTSNLTKIRAAPNTPFNEMWWFWPSRTGGSGENDSYVKVNITEPGMPWDYGPMPRSAWTDQNVLGNPLGANPGGIIYQHETTMDADGSPLSYSFTTGYFEIAEGEDFAFVDLILPDFKWGFVAGSQNAQVQLTFNVVNYPGDTPTIYGPYTVNQGTEYISVRFRGRQMSITVAGSDLGSFMRLGRVRYRWAPTGRR